MPLVAPAMLKFAVVFIAAAFLLERHVPLLCFSVVLCGPVPPLTHVYTSVHTVLQPRR